MTVKRQRSLEKKIAEIKAVTRGERDLYPYIRDLLTRKEFGIELRPDQIVVDVAVAGGRDAPDLTVYGTKDGKPIKTPDHAIAVFEVKKGAVLRRGADAIFQEKKKYIQPGTRHFFLMDQEVVIRHDLPPHKALHEFTLDELTDPEVFARCFGVIGPESLKLEAQLIAFQRDEIKPAYQSIDEIGRHHFISTIREVAGLLNEAITSLIDRKVVPDLTTANAEIDRMKAEWGEPHFAWEENGHPVEFEKLLDEEALAELTQDDVARYEEEHDLFAARVEPYLYALRIEHQLLKDYAVRMGIEGGNLSLLAPRKQGNKLTDSGRAVESFAYETASLIVSRMLMVRFSEDHNFLKRCISNGGVKVFADYARYYRKPMQALLKETYVQSRDLYRNLFDSSLLDWALYSDDAVLSDALLHSMYLLSRWDFRTIHGDILSGVYDHYLDTAKRRALGEVFTRPEIARYILERCGYDATKTVLDPGCGTGTFLVEALNQDIKRLKSRGALNETTIVSVLNRLHGLDINPFSVALAQIQVLWHLIDLFAGRTSDEIKKLCAAIIPAIQIAGGHSSLDPLGTALPRLGEGGQVQIPMSFNVETTTRRRKLAAKVSRRFRQISQDSYDILAANPPYVRTHRQAVDGGITKAYEQVLHGVTDLYVHFIYRALATWLGDGGTMGFIVPIGVLEATYAGKLRSILRDYKILEIADLEPIGRKTFHGVKRQTVILIVQKSSASEEDAVTQTTLYPDCYVEATDTIDFSKAVQHTVKRKHTSQDYYLPDEGSQPDWMGLIKRPTGEESTLLSKLSPDDVRILEWFRDAPRLGSITQKVFMKQVKGQPTLVAKEVPEGEDPKLWEPGLLLGVGLELGGSRALAQEGLPIYKGQNIFPSGLRGAPMGKWDPETSRLKAVKIFAYRSLFDYERLFAVRNIAQLPTACRVPEGAAFQNTALIAQLTTDLPLHVYLLSRIPQWYAAKILRSSIVEDLGCTWIKRQVALLPVPARLSPQTIRAMNEVGQEVLDADMDLAHSHRHVDALIAAAGGRTLYELIAYDDPRCRSLDMSGLSPTPVPVTGLYDDGEGSLVADNLLFRFPVDDVELRKYLAYIIGRMLDSNPKLELGRDEVGNLMIPDNLSDVVAEINKLEQTNLKQTFYDALDRLDAVVGKALGLPQADVDYIRGQMTTDGFLRELRPMLEQRGLRVQPYADHSGGDRYS
jgi:SAM-dependent methyltransferase